MDFKRIEATKLSFVTAPIKLGMLLYATTAYARIRRFSRICRFSVGYEFVIEEDNSFVRLVWQAVKSEMQSFIVTSFKKE